jgi:hypothetical protein
MSDAEANNKAVTYPKGFIAAVLAPVCLALVLLLGYTVWFAASDVQNFRMYFGFDLIVTSMIAFGTLICGLVVSLLGCLVIGVPMQFFLQKRGLTSWGIYLAGGIIAGVLISLVISRGLAQMHLGPPFTYLVATEIVAGGALSALAFWWFSRPRVTLNRLAK